MLTSLAPAVVRWFGRRSAPIDRVKTLVLVIGMAMVASLFAPVGLNSLGGAYRILGVSPSADQDSIERQFRRLALTAHPDRSTGTQPAYARLVAAKEVLRPARRFLYDRLGAHPVITSWAHPPDTPYATLVTELANLGRLRLVAAFVDYVAGADPLGCAAMHLLVLAGHSVLLTGPYGSLAGVPVFHYVQLLNWVPAMWAVVTAGTQSSDPVQHELGRLQELTRDLELVSIDHGAALLEPFSDLQEVRRAVQRQAVVAFNPA